MNLRHTIVLTGIPLILITASCSRPTVAASHNFSDGCRATIVGTLGDEHFLVYSLEVRNSGGKLLHSESLTDIPYGFEGGFDFEDSGDGLVVTRDDTDLGYLTTYWHPKGRL